MVSSFFKGLICYFDVAFLISFLSFSGRCGPSNGCPCNSCLALSLNGPSQQQSVPTATTTTDYSVQQAISFDIGMSLLPEPDNYTSVSPCDIPEAINIISVASRVARLTLISSSNV